VFEICLVVIGDRFCFVRADADVRRRPRLEPVPPATVTAWFATQSARNLLQNCR
jgi:hypothetical protein